MVHSRIDKIPDELSAAIKAAIERIKPTNSGPSIVRIIIEGVPRAHLIARYLRRPPPSTPPPLTQGSTPPPPIRRRIRQAYPCPLHTRRDTWRVRVRDLQRRIWISLTMESTFDKNEEMSTRVTFIRFYFTKDC